MYEYLTARDLFVKRTVAANDAKTGHERECLTAERRGILDTIKAVWGDVAAGGAIMDADSYYLSQGQDFPMVGGLNLDWEEVA